MSKKRAVIFGVTGQDGSYLSEFLLSKQYDIAGVARRTSVDNTSRLEYILTHPSFNLEEGDITDYGSVFRIISKYQPDEVYNLAAMSHVGTSFNQPSLSFDITAKGCLNILESVREVCPSARFYQASSSEMFGDSYSFARKIGRYQSEETEFNPRSPYAIAKLAAHQAAGLYREAYDLYTSCGILFNHESERRGDKFVTKKITRYINELYQHIKESKTLGLDFSTYVDNSSPKLSLGNIYASRDWGHAEDYVQAMWMMLQQDEPDDYVICTGETHTVEEFLIESFNLIGIEDHTPYVVKDENLMRPLEVPFLKGDYSRASEELGWQPRISFKELVSRMVLHEIKDEEEKNDGF